MGCLLSPSLGAVGSGEYRLGTDDQKGDILLGPWELGHLGLALTFPSGLGFSPAKQV